MIYLDSNVFIYAIINKNEKGKRCREILKKVAGGYRAGFTSTLTWDEVFFSLMKIKGIKIASSHGKMLLEFPRLIFIPVDKKIIFMAQNISEKYSLKPRDSIHAACAINNNLKEFISDDGDFDKVGEFKRIKI